MRKSYCIPDKYKQDTTVSLDEECQYSTTVLFSDKDGQSTTILLDLDGTCR